MNLKTFASALVVAAMSLAPVAVGADQGNGGRQRGGGRSTAGAPAQRNDGGRQAAVREAPPRQSAPQGGQARSRSSEPQPYAAPAAPPPQPRSEGGRAVPRSQPDRQYGGQPAPRQYGAQEAPRSYGGQPAPRQNGTQATPRQYGGQQAPRQYGAPTVPRSGAIDPAPRRAVPRPSYEYGPQGRPGYSTDRGYGNYGNRRYVEPPHYYYARPYYGRTYVRPYSWVPYRPYYFTRPYYSFRSWFSIGFGLSIGYPVPYPYAYLGTYTPRVYGYYPQGYSVTPSVSVYGGISFDIQPLDADVWVDDEYVGTVGTFTPYGEPLTLTPGQHRIVVQRQGYRTMEWDVMVEPGQVIPYQGAMQPY